MPPPPNAALFLTILVPPFSTSVPLVATPPPCSARLPITLTLFSSTVLSSRIPNGAADIGTADSAATRDPQIGDPDMKMHIREGVEGLS